MSLELSTQCGIPMGLEQHLIEIGVIPASPLEEIGIVAATRECYNQLPQPEGRRLTGSSYDEETQEYMF